MCSKSGLQFVVLISKLIFKVDGFHEGAFNLDTRLSGKIPSDISPVKVRSLTDCGNECTSQDACVGFYYSLVDNGCFLDTSSTNHATFVTNLFTEHFILSVTERTSSPRRLSASLSAGASSGSNLRSIKASSTSVQSSTTPRKSPPKTSPITPITSPTSILITSSHVGIAIVSNSACPPQFEKDIIVQGQSAFSYRFKIIDANETKDEAVTTCTAHGMHLLKVNNIVKIQDLSKFLNGCNVYNGIEYWTDATMPTNTWKNSDGSAIPKSAWCHGTPGSNVSKRCARLSPGCGFKLKDHPCNRSNKSKFAVICE